MGDLAYVPTSQSLGFFIFLVFETELPLMLWVHIQSLVKLSLIHPANKDRPPLEIRCPATATTSIREREAEP